MMVVDHRSTRLYTPIGVLSILTGLSGTLRDAVDEIHGDHVLVDALGEHLFERFVDATPRSSTNRGSSQRAGPRPRGVLTLAIMRISRLGRLSG
jgi:hypothetical protein